MVTSGHTAAITPWRAIPVNLAIVLARDVDEDHRGEHVKTTDDRMSTQRHCRRRTTVTLHHHRWGSATLPPWRCGPRPCVPGNTPGRRREALSPPQRMPSTPQPGAWRQRHILSSSMLTMVIWFGFKGARPWIYRPERDRIPTQFSPAPATTSGDRWRRSRKVGWESVGESPRPVDWIDQHQQRGSFLHPGPTGSPRSSVSWGHDAWVPPIVSRARTQYWAAQEWKLPMGRERIKFGPGRLIGLIFFFISEFFLQIQFKFKNSYLKSPKCQN
jgi:hypothetical protein